MPWPAGGARAAGAGGDHASAGGAVRRQRRGGGVLRQGGRRLPAGHVPAGAQQVRPGLWAGAGTCRRRRSTGAPYIIWYTLQGGRLL